MQKKIINKTMLTKNKIFWVDKKLGCNNYPGTKDRPFRTLEKALSKGNNCTIFMKIY